MARSNKTKPWGVHWFRRDLRLTGNSALLWNSKKHDGRVLGVFAFDPAILSRPDFSATRFRFYLETLKSLRADLRKQGGELICLDDGPDHGFRRFLGQLAKAGRPLPSVWSWNRDYEPFAVARDSRIQQLLETEFGIAVHTERDHLLIEPRELFKGDSPGSHYQVFTPFSKRWKTLLDTPDIASRLKSAHKKLGRLKSKDIRLFDAKSRPTYDLLERYEAKLPGHPEVPMPPVGEAAAREQLRKFKKQALSQYTKGRDFPALNSTSHLSIYFKNGSITSAQVISDLKRSKGPLSPGARKFLQELIWREFYYHILSHVPRVETTAFHFKYERLEWENRDDFFEAWKEGRTGFPIVDAGMRQLLATGWMHNRVRMIVASFLTKDLHCDWKWGERYFMRLLIDGDLALNNGGWQWAASTGCDPQPYFRIFNPTLQSKRFDPKGDYIRRWVPELRTLNAREIHEPWRKRDLGVGYPRPIVEHGARARQAIAMYRRVR